MGNPSPRTCPATRRAWCHRRSASGEEGRPPIIERRGGPAAEGAARPLRLVPRGDHNYVQHRSQIGWENQTAQRRRQIKDANRMLPFASSDHTAGEQDRGMLRRVRGQGARRRHIRFERRTRLLSRRVGRAAAKKKQTEPDFDGALQAKSSCKPRRSRCVSGGKRAPWAHMSRPSAE